MRRHYLRLRRALLGRLRPWFPPRVVAFVLVWSVAGELYQAHIAQGWRWLVLLPTYLAFRLLWDRDHAECERDLRQCEKDRRAADLVILDRARSFHGA